MPNFIEVGQSTTVIGALAGQNQILLLYRPAYTCCKQRDAISAAVL